MFIKSIKARSTLWMVTLWLVFFVAGYCDGVPPAPLPKMVQSSDIVGSESEQGVTPFIRFVFTPKPMDVIYTLEAVSRRWALIFCIENCLRNTIVGTPGSTQFSQLEFDGTLQKKALAAQTKPPFTTTRTQANTIYWAIGMIGATASPIWKAWPSSSTGMGAPKQWDFAALLGDFMLSQGDAPGTFICPGFG